jgi:hypothetical protein
MSRAAQLAAVAQNRNPEIVKEAALALAIEGKSYGDIAVDLGLTKGIVAGIVYRARRAGDTRIPPASKGGGQSNDQKAAKLQRVAKPESKRFNPRNVPAIYKAFGSVEPAQVAAIAIARRDERERKMAAPDADWQPLALDIMAIRDGLCRWPLWRGDPPISEKFFCGLPAVEGKSYCPRCQSKSVSPRSETAAMDRKLGIAQARKAA